MSQNKKVMLIKKTKPKAINGLSASQKFTAEKAQAQLQQLLSSSAFVKFTKTESLSKKGVPLKKFDINVDKLLKKMDDKSITLADLKKLKTVFYLNEDYDSEEQMYQLKYGTKKEIISSLIDIRRFELQQTLADKKLQNHVAKEIKENLDELNDPDDEEGIDPEQLLNQGQICDEDVDNFIKTCQDKFKEKEEILEKYCKSERCDKVKTFITDLENKTILAYSKQKSKKKNEKMDVDEDKKNEAVKNQEKKNNKEEIGNEEKAKEEADPNHLSKATVNKKIREIKSNVRLTEKTNVYTFLENRMKITESITNALKEVNNNTQTCINICELMKKNSKVKDRDVWKYLNENKNNFNDIKNPLEVVIDQESQLAKGLYLEGSGYSYANLINLNLAMCTKIHRITECLNLIWQYLMNESAHKDLNFRLGDKASKYNNEALHKIKNLSGYNNKGNYIEQDEWRKMSDFDRNMLRFNFSDRNQLPPTFVFNKFKREEKVLFLQKRLEFRSRRIQELLELSKNDNEDKTRTAGIINAFVYYTNRDINGFMVTFDDKLREEVFKKFSEEDKKQYLEKYDELVAQLTEFSNNNMVIGTIKCRKRLLRCYGVDFSHYVNAKNFPIKPFKPFGRRYVTLNRGYYRGRDNSFGHKKYRGKPRFGMYNSFQNANNPSNNNSNINNNPNNNQVVNKNNNDKQNFAN